MLKDVYISDDDDSVMVIFNQIIISSEQML